MFAFVLVGLQLHISRRLKKMAPTYVKTIHNYHRYLSEVIIIILQSIFSKILSEIYFFT